MILSLSASKAILSENVLLNECSRQTFQADDKWNPIYLLKIIFPNTVLQLQCLKWNTTNESFKLWIRNRTMLCWCLPEDISITLSVLEYSLSNVSQSLASFYLLNKPKSGYKYFVEPYRTFGAHTHLLQWSWFWGIHFFKVKKYTVYADWIDVKIPF